MFLLLPVEYYIWIASSICFDQKFENVVYTEHCVSLNNLGVNCANHIDLNINTIKLQRLWEYGGY